jgi:hypothetical protein
MQIRLATREDLVSLTALVSRVVPLMRAQGNLQWDDTYPNPEVFGSDIERGQLWVAEVDGRIAGVVAITGDRPTTSRRIGITRKLPSSSIVWRLILSFAEPEWPALSCNMLKRSRGRRAPMPSASTPTSKTMRRSGSSLVSATASQERSLY